MSFIGTTKQSQTPIVEGIIEYDPALEHCRVIFDFQLQFVLGLLLGQP